MKALLLLFIHIPLWGMEFRKFGALELGAQVTSGAVGAGLGYLFLQSSAAASGQANLNGTQTLIGISVGYTLGVIFSGKLFQGKGNPFLTLIGNFVPFVGPLIAYHLSAGSIGFSDSLALFNLQGGKLSLGLPLPYRKTALMDESREALYYINLVMINL